MAASQHDDLNKMKCDKINLPYLDWRINPKDLDFNEADPVKSINMLDTLDAILIEDGDKEYHYSTYAIIGEGKFGKVYLAQNTETNEWVAIKRIMLDSNNLDKSRGHVKREEENLKLANMFIASNTLKKMKVAYIVMKLTEGHELYDTLVRPRKKNELPQQFFSTLQRLYISKKILKNAADLHKDKQGIIANVKKEDRNIIHHRDLKNNNIMLNPATHTVRIIDFGFAISTKLPATPSNFATSVNDETKAASSPGKSLSRHLMGTPMFMSPEQIDTHFNNENLITNSAFEYDEKTEMYALGMTIAELLKLTIPTNDNGISRFLIHDTSPFANIDVVAFIKRMTANAPNDRPTVTEAAAFFNREFAKEAGKKDCGLNVCTITLSEFFGMTVQDQNEFIAQLLDKKIIAVILRGDEQTTNKDYYLARYQLINAGIINVAPFMMKGTDHMEIDRQIKDFYDQQFASIHTTVFTYRMGYIFESKNKERTELLLLIDSRLISISQFFAESSADKAVIVQLIELAHRITKIEELIKTLEAAYGNSINNNRGMFDSVPTSKEMNEKLDKYNFPRALGVLLSSVYKAMDNMPEFSNYKKRFSDVSNIDSNLMTNDGHIFSDLAFKNPSERQNDPSSQLNP